MSSRKIFDKRPQFKIEGKTIELNMQATASEFQYLLSANIEFNSSSNSSLAEIKCNKINNKVYFDSA